MGYRALDANPNLNPNSDPDSDLVSSKGSYRVRAPRFKSYLLAGSLIVAIALPGAPCFADAEGADKGSLTTLEKRLFFKTYADDNDEVRLGRLEKQVFGAPVQGDFHERLSRLQGALGPQENPDGTVSGAAAQPPPPPMPSPQEQQQEAMDRARSQVQAAQDQEINRLLSDGVSLYRSKHGHEALEKFEQVLHLDSHNAEAHFSMGIIYESMGSFVEAVASYKNALAEFPANKEYQDAVAAAQKKMEARSKVDEKQTELRGLADEAAAAYKRGEYMSALDLYHQLDEKAPNQALVKYNLGTLYLATKNPYRALEYYQQARKLQPGEQRYITACEQLEHNLKAADDQRVQSENAWVGKDQGSAPAAAAPAAGSDANKGKGKKKKEKVAPPAPSNQLPIGNNPGADAMANYGIIARSSHEGVVITAVGIASRASRVGLLKGDIIKAVDGTVVTRTNEINDILGKKAGASVQMTIQRVRSLGTVTL